MHKHPDADSFVLEHLRQPANATTRLVFADWLEDTGTPSNVAWAHYIRLREQAERTPPDERRTLLRKADICAAKVRAKLNLAARVFARNPESVLQLIPAPNVSVRLADYTPARAVLELVPESVARENLVLPLTLHGNTLYCTAINPHDYDTAQKLSFILNKDIVLVGATRDEVRAAINRGYGETETESVDSVFWEFPAAYAGLPEADAPVARLVELLLAQTAGRTDAVRFDPEPDSLVVRERFGGLWYDRDHIPRRLLRPVLTRLAALADLDPAEVFAPPRTAYPLEGSFVFPVQSARFRVEVTIHPSPDAPVTELAISEAPA